MLPIQTPLLIAGVFSGFLFSGFFKLTCSHKRTENCNYMKKPQDLPAAFRL